jgi:2-polyprenyl-3-methyl-5-hydroxy-6-metoxy-1,4-benzoquinol methylase/acyl carrier protein
VGGEAIDPDLWRTLAASSEVDFNNVYGPTESTVDATVACLTADATTPHIGRPMENRYIRILDRCGQPVPIGVSGEIHIGGAGVARGYLNRAELTRERFLPDPFGHDREARLYKTGDLGRWRADGVIEYLGRNDHQVKIRGFRIELGEIEAQLSQHPQVKEAVVLARPNELADQRLVAYVAVDVPQRQGLQQAGSKEAIADIVSQWNRVHDETYSASEAAGPTFIGWNSSYTGQPIPQAEMREWLTCTVARIQSLQPGRVLEIGCGVGLLLQHLAPRATVYVGTDFAASALSNLQHWMRGRKELEHVQLLHRSATELQDLASGSFDTIILNSVVQYFPHVEYLLAVLGETVRLVGPGGKIFLGDIRHQALQPMFHSAVQLTKAAATVSVGQIRKRAARALAQDKELVIDPDFFHALPGRLSGVSAVEVQLKRGRAENELTRYRYDVVLHVGAQVGAQPVCESLEWGAAIAADTNLEAALSERHWCAVQLRSIPNTRLAKDAAALRLLETSEEHLEANALRRQLAEMKFAGVDADTFWESGEAYGYDVRVSWRSQDASGRYDVQLLDRIRADQVARAAQPLLPAVKNWREYTSDPLENSFRQQLIPQLREYLKEHLPEYMLPSAWVVLKQLPLTQNGKVDRAALPEPQGRGEEVGEHVAPRTELERVLADMWAQILQIDQVGVRDNFFEIGGHSLLAMQVIVRIRSSLSIDIPMSVLFGFPTVEQLSTQVERLRQEKLLGDIETGGDEMEELLGQVAAMPEDRARELVRALRLVRENGMRAKA